MNTSQQESRPPWGALIVVAVGLLASLAAALLANANLVGSAQLEWTASKPIPDSKAVALPGSEAKIRLVEGKLRASEPNFATFKLYRVSSVLQIDAGAPIGRARVECITRVPRHVTIATTTVRRAAFPLSTSDEAKLQKQEVKDNVLLQFSARGSSLSVLEFADVFDKYTNIDGVKVEWPPFRPAQEVWRWYLPEGKPGKPVRLGFASIWRTREAPQASNSCTVTTGDGPATVTQAASLG